MADQNVSASSPIEGVSIEGVSIEAPARSDEPINDNEKESDSSLFSSFGGLSLGRLQTAVKRATTSTPSASATKSGLVMDDKNSDNDEEDTSRTEEEASQEELHTNISVVFDSKGILVERGEDDVPSETESITTDDSKRGDLGLSCAASSTADELPLLLETTKVQLLYGQLHDRERTIQQLQEERLQTREEFQVLEKESAECMEELTGDIQDLQDKLLDKDDIIRELESLQVIPEHGTVDDADADEDGEERLEKLKQQVEERDRRIQELKDEGRRNEGGEEESHPNRAKIMAELEKLQTTLKEKDVMLEKLEESENLNFTLVEERDEEIVRLNDNVKRLQENLESSNERASEQAAELEALQNSTSSELEAANLELEKLVEKDQANKIWLEEHQVKMATLTQLLNDNNNNHQETPEAATEELENLLEERDDECSQLEAEILSQKEELVDQVLQIECLKDELNESQQIAAREINELNQQLGDQKLEIEQMQRDTESKPHEEFKALGTSLEEREAECRELYSKVDNLASELHSARQQQKDETEREDEKTNELSVLLQTEKSRLDELTEKLESLTLDLSKRDQKVFHLGFNSDDELIEALRETQKHLRDKEVELEKLALSQSSVGRASSSRELSSVSGGSVTAESPNSAQTSKEDPKSIETLLERQKDLRKELEDKMKSLATDMRNWDSGEDETTNLLANAKAFYSYLSGQIRSIVFDLKARENVSDDLVKAFQLKLQHASSMEKALEAREVQIEMLVQELEELERHNLGTSANSSSSTSSQSLLLSSKLEQLLNDIHQRDEKLKVLEWLTVDLSKTLDTKTDEFEELKEVSAEEKNKLEKRVNLLLNDVKDREVKIQGLKDLIEAEEEIVQKCVDVEAKLCLETSQRAELETTVGSLTKELRDAEGKISSFEAELVSKDSFIQLREAQLENASGLETSLATEKAKREELQFQAESLNAALMERDIEMESMLLEMQEKRDIESRVSVMQEELEEKYHEVDTLACSLAAKDHVIGGLEQERESKIEDCKDLEHEIASLMEELTVKEQRNDELEAAATKELELQVQNGETADDLLHGMSQENAKLSEQLQELKEQNSSLLSDVQASEEDIKQVPELEQQVAELQTMNKELHDGLTSHTERLEAAAQQATQLEQLTNDNATLLTDLEASKVELVEMSEAVDRLKNIEKQNAKLICDLENQEEQLGQATKLSFQLDELKEHSTSLTCDLNRRESELEQAAKLAREQQHDLEEQNTKLRSEMTSLEDRSGHQLEELKEKNSKCLEDLQSRDKQLFEASTFASQMEELKELNATLLADLKGWEARVNELERQVAAKDEVFQEMTVVEQLLEEQKSRHQDLVGEIDSLTNALKEKDNELDLIKELQEGNKPALVDHTHATEESVDLGRQLQEQQQRFSQLSDNMESVAEVLEDREVQMETIERENKLKNEFIDELQQKIDDQSSNMESLMEEHESECAELHAKLESLTGDLRESSFRLLKLEQDQLNTTGDSDKALKQNLQEIQAENRSLTSEKDKVCRRLEAIGFESMDSLVQGLAFKCQEHVEMEKIIEEHEKQIRDLKKDPQRSKSINNDSSRGHVAHIHKIRELEMKIGIFRDEIAGKNEIIQDLTLRLNGDAPHPTKDAPGLRMKRVSVATTNNTKPAPLQKGDNGLDDATAAKTAKALSTMPALMEALKQRDTTIKLQQKEIASNKRAIDALTRGLEFNVQEKIESDKRVHESKTQISQFERIVQEMEQKNRPMKRNLASINDIKALSVNELVDLLRQSRVLAEDFEFERERLIANATNMSIALSESRCKVDELMEQLMMGPNNKRVASTVARTSATATAAPLRVVAVAPRPASQIQPPNKASKKKRPKKRFV